jgi:hypothetical protein
LQLVDPSVHGKKVAFFSGLDRATRCLAAKLEASPPVCGQHLKPEDRPRGCVATLVGQPIDLRRFAAERAFTGMTVPMLTDLLRISLPIEQALTRLPTTEKPIVMMLLAIFLPEKTPAELELLYLLRREKNKADKLVSLIDEEFLEMCGPEVFDEEDLPEIKFHAKRPSTPSDVTEPPERSAPAAKGEPKPRKKQPRRDLPHKTIITDVWARAFIPKTKGSTLTIDLIRHYRWIVEYTQKPDRPRSFSKVFGDESAISKRDALLHVLQWVWDVHTSITGEVCPWRFDLELWVNAPPNAFETLHE